MYEIIINLVLLLQLMGAPTYDDTLELLRD